MSNFAVGQGHTANHYYNGTALRGPERIRRQWDQWSYIPETHGSFTPEMQARGIGLWNRTFLDQSREGIHQSVRYPTLIGKARAANTFQEGMGPTGAFRIPNQGVCGTAHKRPLPHSLRQETKNGNTDSQLPYTLSSVAQRLFAEEMTTMADWL